MIFPLHSMPNFSLAPALDVLCTGSYPRLPSCIRDNIVPPSPLSGSEAESALALLTVAVRRRLLSEDIPPQMAVRSIGVCVGGGGGGGVHMVINACTV